MQDKKPSSQSRSAALLIVFSCIAGSVFLYKYHDVVTANPFKYLAYVVTVIAGGYKEVFKRDETTKKLQLQSFSHWVIPFASVLAVCFLSASSDVRTALESERTAKGQAAQRQKDESKHGVEEANHRAEIADLKRALAEQKLREVAIQGQSKQNQVVQVELAKRTSLEDQRQNEATRHQVTENSEEQKNLITKKNLSDVQRSVQDLKIVQAGFQRNEKGFQLTGEAIKRSVNRIGSVTFSYQVMLPLYQPSMSAYRAKFLETMLKFQLGRLQGDTNDPAFVGLAHVGSQYKTLSGRAVSNERIEILPNSPLYPS